MKLEEEPRGRPYKTRIRDDVSYEDAINLFKNLQSIRYSANPPVTSLEIEVHTGIYTSQLSGLETGRRMPKKQDTLRSLASRIIGWSVPTSVDRKEYEEPIEKKRNIEYQRKYGCPRWEEERKPNRFWFFS